VTLGLDIAFRSLERAPFRGAKGDENGSPWKRNRLSKRRETHRLPAIGQVARQHRRVPRNSLYYNGLREALSLLTGARRLAAILTAALEVGVSRGTCAWT
jgi:hypothetical protein